MHIKCLIIPKLRGEMIVTLSKTKNRTLSCGIKVIYLLCTTVNCFRYVQSVIKVSHLLCYLLSLSCFDSVVTLFILDKKRYYNLICLKI